MTSLVQGGSFIHILLVEDNPGDVRLTLEVFKEAKILNVPDVVRDGVEALAYLRKEGKFAGKRLPDIILLDLNLPKKDGRTLLSEIKNDPGLKDIPVVVLTGSDDDADILKTYDLHASNYLVKPINVEKFIEVMRTEDNYWFAAVKLPPPASG